MSGKPSYISRLAPTPNGQIHWGNLWNFALTWALVRRSGGKLWLRFDDIDSDRCEERFAEGTRQVLRFLKLDWDGEYANQRQHMQDYRNFLHQIPHYVCDCSRQDIHRRTGDFHYDGHCRQRELTYRAGENAVRFKHPLTPAGDFILWRREDLPAYHLTCLFDDMQLGTNLIVRGTDLIESSSVQQELSRSLPLDPFQYIDFIHHPLLLNRAGEKLSKSRGDGELLEMINKGAKGQDIFEELSLRVGLKTSINKAEDLLTILDTLPNLCPAR